MFRNRTSAQRPSDELYASFRQHFPELCSVVTTTNASTAAAHGRANSVGGDTRDSVAAARKLRGGNIIPEHDELKDHDSTPRGNSQDSWRLTPAWLDPDPFALASLVNPPDPSYDVPTSTGSHDQAWYYHGQAGDLHTPGMGLGLGTPLSLSTSQAGSGHVGALVDLQLFTPAPRSTHHHSFRNFRALDPVAPFASVHFDDLRRPTGAAGTTNTTTTTTAGTTDTTITTTTGTSSFDPIDTSTHLSPPPPGDHPLPGRTADADMPGPSSAAAFPSTITTTSFGQAMRTVSLASAEPSVDANDPWTTVPDHADPGRSRFRFHVTLNAPTAMVRSSDEIPITYLNKGQAYSMSIVDTAPPALHLGPARYRTVIRISFEDEQQRRRPAACWQLWKEGRGSSEAHQRAGRLQAVEYVESTSSASADEAGGNVRAGTAETSTSPPLEVERTSFDGFSVHWTAIPGGNMDQTVALRFNFLSTDFSHSKGVKGIPVRLCAKTEVVPSLPSPPSLERAEVCYCRVKLFRDHGAERKLANDIAHVKKTIDKLKQQIAQAETGMRDFGKRKRGGSIAAGASAVDPAGGRPGKVPKSRRTWSVSSTGSAGGRASIEEDLHLKLATMQDMFTSTRPVSVLHLPGDDLDDPDAHPVPLPGDFPDLARMGPASTDGTWQRRASAGTSHSTATSSRLVSPVSSVSGHDLRPPGTLAASARHASTEWSLFQAIAPVCPPATAAANPQHLASPPDQPVKVPKLAADDQAGLSRWIEALGVDSSYQPPPERTVKPAACLYIRPVDKTGRSDDRYYRAVYLMHRTLEDLVQGIAAKLEIYPTRIRRTIFTSKHGITILVDDDVVRELPEGQDMLVECSSTKKDVIPRKREWDSGAMDVQVDGDVSTSSDLEQTTEMELRLIF